MVARMELFSEWCSITANPNPSSMFQDMNTLCQRALIALADAERRIEELENQLNTKVRPEECYWVEDGDYGDNDDC